MNLLLITPQTCLHALQATYKDPNESSGRKGGVSGHLWAPSRCSMHDRVCLVFPQSLLARPSSQGVRGIQPKIGPVYHKLMPQISIRLDVHTTCRGQLIMRIVICTSKHFQKRKKMWSRLLIAATITITHPAGS